MTQKIIIDCDPGIDDAVALLLAMASPDELEVLAVTTVAGNVSADLTNANARRIRALARRPEIPVHAGCTRPILRQLVTADHVHGKTGLNGCELPLPSGAPEPGHAVDAIIELAARYPGEIVLVPVGPLTNVALALLKASQLAADLAGIVLMGGAAGRGNVTEHAEFNFHVDPHAARIVMESGVPIVMYGLDVTRDARASDAWISAVGGLGTRVGQAVAGMLSFYSRAGGAGLHDVLAVGHLLFPDLFEGRKGRVSIITDEVAEIGRSVVDHATDTPNATVMYGIQTDRFLTLLAERLARYSD